MSASLERPGADAILSDLNPSQREAVEHGDGPLLVVAGPGSGKTRVITRRVARLVRAGVRPWRVLAITFTNKAAGEMRERIARLLEGERETNVYVSTFHSFCARMLRRYGAPSRGFAQDYTIYDEDDQRAAVRQALAEANLEEKQWKPGSVLSEISAAKNRMEGPDERDQQAIGYADRTIARVYRIYERLLAEWKALDFDDLLLEMVKLLREREDVRAELADRFRYVLVDEFQDTNRPQYEIARMIAAHGNLCVVGDVDQSVYGWRGADIGNILEFERDHPGCRVVRLETNYRSTKRILEAACSLIAHNVRRIENPLSTPNEEGEALRLVACLNDDEEARFVARSIERTIREDDVAPGEIAVFYRTNALSRKVEQELLARGIAYAVIGALAFYERKEVKDVLAYLRILGNPGDEPSVIRALHSPPRGVGATSVEKLRARAKERGLTLAQATVDPEAQTALAGKALRGLKEFGELLETISLLAAQRAPLRQMLDEIVDRSRYTDALRESRDPQDRARVENVHALLDAAEEFDRQQGHAGDLREFLDHIALLTDVDRTRTGPDRVNLMTFHAAKGLEFDEVYMIGLEEGMLPLVRELEAQDLEEERRLCYVAITRARKRLSLTYARVRRYFGMDRTGRPSSFLSEIPDGLLERGSPEIAYGPSDRLKAYARLDGWARERPALAAAPAPAAPASARADRASGAGPDPALRPLPSYAPSAGGFGDAGLSQGTRVEHPHFGAGEIVGLRGHGLAQRVKVRFDSGAEKELVAHYANLRRAAP